MNVHKNSVRNTVMFYNTNMAFVRNVEILWKLCTKVSKLLCTY
jgi:hypothetical protein